MIAVYYNVEACPYTMYLVEVETDDMDELMTKIEEDGYAVPSGDVLFIQNDCVVSQHLP